MKGSIDRFIPRLYVVSRVVEIRLRQLGVGLDLLDLRWLDLDDVEVSGSIRFQRYRRIIDVDIIDAIEQRSPLPVVVIGGERPLLVFGNTGHGERSVADVVLRGLPPVFRVRLDDLRLDWEGDPEREDRVVVRRRVGQVDFERLVIDRCYAQASARFFILLGRELNGVSLVIGADLGELSAADDFEENRLVLTSDLGSRLRWIA